MGTWNDEPKSGTVNYGKGVVYKQPPDTSQVPILHSMYRAPTPTLRTLKEASQMGKKIRLIFYFILVKNFNQG